MLVTPEEPPQTRAKQAHYDWPSSTLPMLAIGFHGPAFSDRKIDKAALDLLAKIGFSSSSLLYQKLVIEEQKCLTLGANFADRRDPYLLIFNAVIKKDKDLPYVENEIFKEIERLKEEPVSEEILADIKSNLKYSFAGKYYCWPCRGIPSDFPVKIMEDFSSLPEGRTPRLNLPEQRIPEGLELVIADKKTPATAISMGFPVSSSKADDDFFALWIAISHFGEHRQHLSHLFQKIREERGQNYGDYAYADHFVQGRGKFPALNHCHQQQYFSIWIRPLANSNRHFVVRQALRELQLQNSSRKQVCRNRSNI